MHGAGIELCRRRDVLVGARDMVGDGLVKGGPAGSEPGLRAANVAASLRVRLRAAYAGLLAAYVGLFAA